MKNNTLKLITMKTTKLIALFAAAGLVFAACEKPETEDQTIAVESVSLDETISEGHELTEGATLDISDYVTVLPENATDKTVTYSSSKTDVATVSETGVITAIATGETVITVTAGDKTATFTLTVKEKPAGTVSVESITLADDIKNGKSLEAEQTLDISSLITVLPENATDKTVSYASSNEDAATITDAGVITAVAEGKTVITITSKSDADVKAEFTLTVTAKTPVNITEIKVSESAKTYTSEDRKTYDLSEYFTVEPAENSDAVTFASSNEDVAKIENGQMTIGLAGEATITIAAQSNPEIKATITVTVDQYKGDYPRFEGDENGGQAAIEGENWYWTMTFSDPLYTVGDNKLINGRNNSLTAMIDGRHIVNRAGTGNVDDANLSNGTAFCVKARGTAADHTASFTINMGKKQKVNYFRIRNISEDKADVLVRFKKFTEISGSNDNVTFTPISSEVDFTSEQGAQPEGGYKRETGNIEITESEYQYLKFSFRGTECFNPEGSAGSSAQIEEFYLGYDAE